MKINRGTIRITGNQRTLKRVSKLNSNSKINIGLYGGSGKMGRVVEQMLCHKKIQNNFFPFLFIGKTTSDFFANHALSINKVDVDVLADVHVWIDFSSSRGLANLLRTTEKLKTAIVSGSTGLSQLDFARLKKYATKRNIFWAANMSLGLWAFRQAMSGFSNIAHFDFAIEEIHHSQKKDKPSGTAKTLHADLERITEKKIEVPVSFRLGGVLGIHTLYAASENEIIMLQHQALNREVFAEGALMAGKWLIQQKPGLYSMDDIFLKTK